jgi:hypothetical protein
VRVLLSDGSGLTARQTAAQLADAGQRVDLLSPDPLCLVADGVRNHALTPGRLAPAAGPPAGVLAGPLHGDPIGVSSIQAAARHWHINSAVALVLPDGSRRAVFVAEMYTSGNWSGTMCCRSACGRRMRSS